MKAHIDAAATSGARDKDGLPPNPAQQPEKEDPGIVETELEVILDNTSQGIRIINRNFTIRRINKAFAELSGISPEEAVGRKCWHIFKGPFCNTPQCRLRRILAGEKIIEDEIDRAKRDGSTVPCIVTAAPLISPGGKLIGIVETFQDITRRRMFQEQVGELEDLNQALIDLGTKIGEAFVTLRDINGIEGVQTSISAQWPRITGYSKKELLGTPFFDLVSPQDREFSIRRHRQKMAGMAMPDLFELSIIRKNGVEIPIELTSAAVTLKGETANMVYIRDISDRKQAEEALRQSENLYHTLFETTGAATFMLDEDGRILVVNREWEKLLGYSREEAQGEHLKRFIHQSCMEAMEKRFRQRLQKQASVPEKYETKMVDKQGNVKDMLVSARMVPGTKGRVVSCLDITGLKQVQSSLRRSTSSLRLLSRRMIENQEAERARISANCMTSCRRN